jgi:energy-coupling factor transporter ATP-binding protein EcfA2
MNEATYSPISWMILKNFRNLEDVKIEFNDSPIVSLVGENEAGKTSVVKGMAVLMQHAYANKHKDYIRDDTNGFGLAMQFADGTQVIRMKTGSFNKYQIKNAAGQMVWETSKIDSGLPPQVQALMGISEEEETKQLLQIRTYEDQLMFVATPSSTNYKVMYNALKVEQITSGIKAGSQEANRHKSSIQEKEVGIKTLEESMERIVFIDVSALTRVRDVLDSLRGRVLKANSILNHRDSIVAERKKLGAIALINDPSMDTLDLGLAMRANTVLETIDNLLGLKQRETQIKLAEILEPINVGILGKISRIQELKAETDRLRAVRSTLDSATEAKSIDLTILNKLNRIADIAKENRVRQAMVNTINLEQLKLVPSNIMDILNKFDQISEAGENISKLQNYKIQCDDYVEKTTEYLKSLNVKVITCPKCGEGIVLDGEAS